MINDEPVGATVTSPQRSPMLHVDWLTLRVVVVLTCTAHQPAVR